MTAASRVARTQAQLRVVAVVSALLWTAAVLLGVLAIELVAGWWARGSLAPGRGWNSAMALAVLAGAWVLWRARFVLSRRRVAIWMEERAPSLQYALITASDPLATGDIALLERMIDQSNIDVFVRPAVLTPIIYSGVALSVMGGAFAAALTLASGRTETIVRDVPPGADVTADAPDRLLRLTVRVTPPAYVGGPARHLNDPSGVTALVGSRIALRGSGRAAGIHAGIGGRTNHVVDADGGWETDFSMPPAATTISLADRGYSRVIALIPVADQPPLVVMIEPTRDTVWRQLPSRAITFQARATDDIGLADGHLEYTVTTGSGEIFKSSTGGFEQTRLKGARSAELRGSLDLGRLGLTPGSILSVRAVVSDDNAITGAATATSDTRTFRLARPDEYDSLAVEAAPPPPMEQSLLTERMLIISAESLLKKRPALVRSRYMSTAGRIGSDQADIRKKVYGILYEQDEAGSKNGVEGDDEELDPQLVLNRDLKEAYDAMWDAERSLNIGDIGIALPFMSRAARALDRARLADRLYLRGRAPRLVVNVEKVRLTGKEKGISNFVVAPRSRADSALARLNTALDAALSLARTDPSGFSDALIRLRADASSVSPPLSSVLGDAVDALKAGRDMTPALIRARRILLGPPRAGNPSVHWSGSWSGAR